MVSVSTTTDRRDGVTLVTARLEGAGVAQRVRLRNQLEGPVWPPRRNGVPEGGWTEGCYEAVVPADETVAVGYASPAPPTDDPLEIAEQTIVDDYDHPEVAAAVDDADHDKTVTPADALRKLGDPSPPRDAIPTPFDDGSDGSIGSDQQAGPQVASTDATQQETDDASRLDMDADRNLEPERPARDREPVQGAQVQGVPAQASAGQGMPGPAPPAVHGWLDAVEERIETAERLAAADTLPEATEAVRAAGGLAEAEALVETLQDEEAALEAIASRADRLAQRSAESDVPLATYDRLA